VDVDLEARIKRLLAIGHPEVDTYEPHGLDLSRRPTAPLSRRTPIWLMPVAAVVAAVVVLLSLTVGPFGPKDAQPNLVVPASPATSVAPSTPAPTETPRDNLEIVVADSPEGAVMSSIVSEGQCATMAIHDFLMDRGKEWDAQIDDSGIDHGWLTDDGLWVGDDLVEVVRAFGGTWGAISTEPPARGLREMWIVTERDGRPMAQQLIPWRTPKGRTVWHRWNTVTVIPCPSNGD
jgi:hypothetical protein